MPQAALREVLLAGGLDCAEVHFAGDDPVLPLRYRVAAAACGSLGALGVSLNELTNAKQAIAVNARSAAVSLRSARYLRVNGKAPAVWDPLSGFYPVRDGWISIHCNFSNHREAAMRVLGTPHERGKAEEASRSDPCRRRLRGFRPFSRRLESPPAGAGGRGAAASDDRADCRFTRRRNRAVQTSARWRAGP
jgi:hypothetical protein